MLHMEAYIVLVAAGVPILWLQIVVRLANILQAS